MTFDVQQHLTKIKGGALYLPVKDRLVWLREDHPDAEITTELVQLDLDSNLAVFRAHVTIPGKGSATGYGSETERDFPAGFIEKAETKSVGRALAHLGFGTQFALELDEGERYSDTPIDHRREITTTRETPRETSTTHAMRTVKNTGTTTTPTTAVADGKTMTAKAPPDPAEETEARHKGLVRVGFAAAGHAQPKGWPDIVQIGHTQYGMEELSEEQLRDDELRRQWLAILVDKLDLPPQTEDQEEDEEAARLVAQYRERIEAATTAKAVNDVMTEARKGAGLEKQDMTKLVEATNARLAALRRTT